jgi:copper chaperone CopZ
LQNDFCKKENIMQNKTFEVPNIGCAGCVRTIKNELSELVGVNSVDATIDTRLVTVAYDTPETWDNIVAKLKEINYAPVGA